ncbi:hypothetical protein V8J36_08070 [Frigidibacter sp. MR17.14]|uniref:hypothetical protein n=1 Tax=Frigidibacter sp. MR17.14 TaxID=3126509 RepID=UPI003012CD1A
MPPVSSSTTFDAERGIADWSTGRIYAAAPARPRGLPLGERVSLLRVSLGLNVALVLLLIGALRPFG